MKEGIKDEERSRRKKRGGKGGESGMSQLDYFYSPSGSYRKFYI